MSGHELILVVEDDQPTRDAMAELLRLEGYDVDTAGNAPEALARIAAAAPALIISDVSMPGGDGFELLTRLRAEQGRRVPVLLVSALADRRRRVYGLDLGADDYLSKPVDIEELFARVRGQLRRARHEHDLEHAATFDPLTNLLNRRGLRDVLGHAHTAAATGTPLSVLLVDVDHFKAINDEHGHQIGDQVLREIAATLVAAVRAVDHVGRLGGDEFLIALPGADAAMAEGLAARLRGRSLASIALAGGGVQRVRGSVGVATLAPNEDIAELLDRADRAMYGAKRTGEIPRVDAD